MTPEQTQIMIDMLSEVKSFREIARRLGVPHEKVRDAAKPFLFLMDLNGTRPLCGCGKPAFHRYGCKITHRPRKNYERSATDEQLAKRRVITEMLISGVRFIDIDHAFGMTKGSAKNWMRHLSDEERSRRAALIPEPRKRNKRRNATIIEMLTAGLQAAVIAEQFGLTVKTVEGIYSRHLTPEQRAERRSNMRCNASHHCRDQQGRFQPLAMAA